MNGFKAMKVSEITASYLGGYGKLRAMIGANHFAFDDFGTLSFQFKGCQKMNVVKFILTDNDDYTIEFIKYKPKTADIRTVSKIEGLYFDQLIEAFERTTGLYLTI
jgi:hypothetical protein